LDKGTDGIKVFVDDNSGKSKRVIFQVKAATVNPAASATSSFPLKQKLSFRVFGYAALFAEKLCFSGVLKYIFAATQPLFSTLDGRHSRKDLGSRREK